MIFEHKMLDILSLGLVQAFANPFRIVIMAQELGKPGLGIDIQPLVMPEGIISVKCDHIEIGHNARSY